MYKFFNLKELIPQSFCLFKKGAYSVRAFGKDCVSGVIVGVVALPLAMAFSIASGGTPAQGLWTAIIAGFFISALGGSTYQIGGPTGAFVVIIFGVISRHGMSGLFIATIIAGLLLCIMGLCGLGKFIKYIPYPVTTGFTTGIGLLIFSQQIKDFFGLRITESSPEFFTKWIEYFKAISTIDIFTLAAGITTIFIIIIIRIFFPKIPGAVIAVFLVTLFVRLFNIPVETIASRFGGIPRAIPLPHLPSASWRLMVEVFPDAVTIALLAAIESLLSAVVADSMTGSVHNSNTELTAQGIGNIASGLLGGIPATGAIARTAANIKSGAVSPVSGIIHTFTLAVFVLFLAPAAELIPLSALSAVLIVVSYDMSNAPRFIRIVKTASKSDAAVLITTFILTVVVDLTFAVVAGLALAIFLFMRRMIETSNVKIETNEVILELAFGSVRQKEADFIRSLARKDIEVFEINGPFFFGMTDLLQNSLGNIPDNTKKIILRMRNVPSIDSTGIAALESFLQTCRKKNIALILVEIREQPHKALQKSGFINRTDAPRIVDTLEDALSVN